MHNSTAELGSRCEHGTARVPRSASEEATSRTSAGIVHGPSRDHTWDSGWPLIPACTQLGRKQKSAGWAVGWLRDQPAKCTLSVIHFLGFCFLWKHIYQSSRFTPTLNMCSLSRDAARRSASIKRHQRAVADAKDSLNRKKKKALLLISLHKANR